MSMDDNESVCEDDIHFASLASVLVDPRVWPHDSVELDGLLKERQREASSDASEMMSSRDNDGKEGGDMDRNRK